MSKLTGRSFSELIKMEAAAVLGSSIQGTTWADTKKITARYTYTEKGENLRTVKMIVVDGKLENVRRIKKYGVMVHLKTKSYWNPKKLNPKWRPLQRALKKAMAYAKKMKGMSKATWYEIASQLKIQNRISPRKAITKTMLSAWRAMQGTKVMPTLAGSETGQMHYTLTMKNYSEKTMSPGAGGMRAFVTSWGGRMEYFEENVSRGVFNTAKNIAKKYPGMDVTDLED